MYIVSEGLQNSNSNIFIEYYLQFHQNLQQLSISLKLLIIFKTILLS